MRIRNHNNTIHSTTNMIPSDKISSGSAPVGVLPIGQSIRDTWKLGHPKFSPYGVGTKVLKKVVKQGNNVSHKLTPRFDGPYTISKVQSNGVTYELQNLNQNKKLIKVHHNQIKPFVEVPAYLQGFLKFDNVSFSLDSAEISSDESDDSNSSNFPCFVMSSSSDSEDSSDSSLESDSSSTGGSSSETEISSSATSASFSGFDNEHGTATIVALTMPWLNQN